MRATITVQNQPITVVTATPIRKSGTSAGEVEIKVPRDRVSSFEPKLVLKRQKDVSEIEEIVSILLH